MENEKKCSKEEKKYTVQEVIDLIEMKMDNSERWDLLERMYDLYYNTRSDYKNPSAEV